MELLEYLIRTLTYKRACLELDLKKNPAELTSTIMHGTIRGLDIAINECYTLVKDLEDDNKRNHTN